MKQVVCSVVATLKKLVKPPSPKWLESIPSQDLDKPLNSSQLEIIARQILEWREIAIEFDLDENDIENIQEDNKSNHLQKRAMMRRWKEIFGDNATLRELIRIAQRNEWNKFLGKVCKALGYGKHGMCPG